MKLVRLEINLVNGSKKVFERTFRNHKDEVNKISNVLRKNMVFIGNADIVSKGAIILNKQTIGKIAKDRHVEIKREHITDFDIKILDASELCAEVPMSNKTYNMSIEMMKEGHKARRESWPSGFYLKMVKIERNYLIEELLNVGSFKIVLVDMNTNTLVGVKWALSEEDIKANDWQIF